MTMAMSSPRIVSIIGAGPVGTLAALYFSNDGWDVMLYDLRDDIRQTRVLGGPASTGKSINLALSHRGIEGLRGASEELAKVVMENVIPVYGRMIHDRRGRQVSQMYDVHGEHINAVDRGWLNALLLDEAEKRPNVEIKFNHKLVKCDFNNKTVKFSTSTGIIDMHTDLVVGADGAHSAVRRELMKFARMDYEQKYIDAAWCEISFPPRKNSKGNDEYALDPNHLHIWPRKTYMLMCLANIGNDKSFTGTLFMSPHQFEDITYPSDIVDFFRANFPDVLPLIGEENLVKQYFQNEKGSLMSLKCEPYHYLDRCVLIGDASHAMVPFYGQGMNCGFEDVNQLFRIIHSTNSLTSAFDQYTTTRKADLFAISDLAMNNYIEMRHSVTSKVYLARKHTEELVYKFFPKLGVRTLYHMVSFTSIPYHIALKRSIRQGKMFEAATVGLGVCLIGTIAYGVFKFKRVFSGYFSS
ncbi:hypothetical protein V1511DRAFT_493527 [Dipodascopsis uninucleata]